MNRNYAKRRRDSDCTFLSKPTETLIDFVIQSLNSIFRARHEVSLENRLQVILSKTVGLEHGLVEQRDD